MTGTETVARTHAASEERRILSYVNLYANTACNSRCATCSFWRQKPLHTLMPERIRTIVESSFAGEQTWFALQGGEFTLHPAAEAILELVAGKNYILFTNLLSVGRAVELIRRHGTRYVTVSLDGGKDGYFRIRGVDAFDRVTAGILRLQEMCSVSVGFTLTPWSQYRDYEEVAAFCRRNGIDFGVNLYTHSHIYEATEPIPEYTFLTQIVEDSKDVFLRAYADWSQGRLQLPCESIRDVASIAPDGTVYLCHNQKIALGNLNEADFEDIWGSAATAELHKKFASCNGCWTSCYRSFDLERSGKRG